MKIIILILAFVIAIGASFKKSAQDMEQLSARKELNGYKSQPNLLPVVEIVAPRA